MNSVTPRTRSDGPLHHLHALAAASVEASRHPIRSPQLGHRNLVRFGWVLIAVAPPFALSHLVIDLPGTGAEFTWWTTTIASYEVVVITVIIGIALAFRTAPHIGDAVVIREQPSS